jgi:hypothetical protein
MNEQKFRQCAIKLINVIDNHFDQSEITDRFTVLKCLVGSEITKVAGTDIDAGLKILDVLNRQLADGIKHICSGKQLESTYLSGFKVKWEGE